MALNLQNEYKYLTGLINKGTTGQAAWAKKQMDTYSTQYGNQWTDAINAVSNPVNVTPVEIKKDTVISNTGTTGSTGNTVAGTNAGTYTGTTSGSTAGGGVIDNNALTSVTNLNDFTVTGVPNIDTPSTYEVTKSYEKDANGNIIVDMPNGTTAVILESQANDPNFLKATGAIPRVAGVTSTPVSSVSSTTQTGTGTGTTSGTTGTGTTDTSYESLYDDKILALLEKYLNPTAYSYDVESDPSYQAYKTQYEREGERAFQDTIGDLTSLTGGRLNSWATSAAAQARNNYAEQLTDIIPTLEGQAYNRYQTEYANIANQLNMLQNLDATSYGRYQDELNFALNEAGLTGIYEGQQTMQGKTTALENELTQLQIDELKDPNSVTNRLNKLQLDTAELNYQYLDDEKKLNIESLTQDLETGKINNEIAQAQLKEITDPNSITNQLNQLNLDTAKLNYQYLEPKIQLEIDSLKQDVESGRINNKLAQAQLSEYTDPNSITNKAKQMQLDVDNLNYQLLSSTLQNKIKAAEYDLELGRISAETAQYTINNLKLGLDENGQPLTGLKYTDYVQMGLDMLNKGNYDSNGTFVKVYTNDDIINWIYGLTTLTKAEKTKLAKDIGV